MAVELDTDGNGAIDIEKGGTNATSAVQALSNLGGQPYDADLDILSSGSFSQKRALIEAFAKPVLGVDALRTTMADFDGDCRYLAYHTASGDGGHGTFCWDAASAEEDDGQDTIAVTGVSTGRWKRNIDPITDELLTHINLTTAHGSTDAPTPGSIVQRDVNGCSSFAPGTGPSHAVIVSQFDGDFSGTNSGWLKLPGGMIIQWGKSITAATENTWIVHDFPIPFPTKAFVIVGTGTDARINLDPDIRLQIYGLSQFRIWNTGYQGLYVNWIALGYGAPQ